MTDHTYQTDHSEELYATLRKVCNRLGTSVPRRVTPLAEYRILLSYPYGMVAFEFVRRAGHAHTVSSVEQCISDLNAFDEGVCWLVQ